MGKEWFTVSEAATILRISGRTVIRYCHDGRLSRARLRLGSRRLGLEIPAESVYTLLNSGKVLDVQQVSA